MKIKKQISAVIISLILLTFFADNVQAQGPNIMFILDNSGSMNFAAYGDWAGDSHITTGKHAEYQDPATEAGLVDVPINYAGGCAEQVMNSRPATGSNTKISMGTFDSGNKSYVGFRFENVGVQQGKAIERAYIQLTSYSDSSETASLNVSGQDVDDAPLFQTDIQNNLVNRFSNDTSAKTTWTPPDWTVNQKDNDTRVDVTGIVQELLNRDEWNSGNDIAFLVEGIEKRDVHSHNTIKPEHSPELHIEYETDAGDDKDFLYYGYFDSGTLDNGTYTASRYSYDGNKFVRDPGGLWDGNWLNWCTSSRMDVLRKVLVGGKLAGTTGDDAITNVSEFSTRGWYRRYDDYTGMNTPYHGNYEYEIDDGRLYVRDEAGAFLADYNIRILKDTDLEPHEFNSEGTALSGVLQGVGNQARWGNMWYDYSDGGWLGNRIANDNMHNVIYDVQDKTCSTWTPVAETYLTAMQYFQQETSYYGISRYDINDVADPYITDDNDEIPFTKSYVILLTDGPSTQDENIPSHLQNTDSDNNETDRAFENNGTDYLDDIAYYSHINDLRVDLEGKQNLSLSVIYAFDDDPDARMLLKDAAINGGFDDMDNDSKPDITGDPRGGEWGDLGHNKEWDEDGNGEPDNYWEADNGFRLKISLLNAINDILESTENDLDLDGITDYLDNCPNSFNPRQKDDDSDSIGDLCDADTVSGTISGDIHKGVSVEIYKVNCGGDTYIGSPITNSEGYYSFGALENGQYFLTPGSVDMAFAPAGVWVKIPIAAIQSYDFTATDTQQ